eukprot:scaffold20295_cov164-Isochrysis_galbana.AAC.2
MGIFLDGSILDEYISGRTHFWMGIFLDGSILDEYISGWAQVWMGTSLDGLISGLVAILDGCISGRAQL